MSSEPVAWSEEKSKQLQGQLSGAWAEDTWYLKDKRKGNVYERPFHFNEFPTASLAVEFKYALWIQFESGYRNANAGQKHLYQYLKHVKDWLNHVAPSTRSLLEKDLEEWVWSLRTYLVEHGPYQKKRSKRLTAKQEYVENTGDDPRIYFFRSIYCHISDAYDDRPETEKDLWC